MYNYCNTKIPICEECNSKISRMLKELALDVSFFQKNESARKLLEIFGMHRSASSDAKLETLLRI